MNTSVARFVVAPALVILGVAFAAVGIQVGEVDDAPGGALLGILGMMALVVIAIRTARRKS